MKKNLQKKFYWLFLGKITRLESFSGSRDQKLLKYDQNGLKIAENQQKILHYISETTFQFAIFMINIDPLVQNV